MRYQLIHVVMSRNLLVIMFSCIIQLSRPPQYICEELDVECEVSSVGGLEDEKQEQNLMVIIHFYSLMYCNLHISILPSYVI